MVLWRSRLEFALSGLASDRSLFLLPGVVVICCDKLLVVGQVIARTAFLGGMIVVVIFG